MDQQQIQHPPPQQTPPKKSLPGRVTSLVKRNAGFATVVIVLLILAVGYLVAREKGWFGLAAPGYSAFAGSATRPAPSKKSKKAGAPSPEVADAETEDLIDSINSAR